MDVFQGCSLVQLKKGMPNIYLKFTKLTFSKLWFSKFKRFVSKKVWEQKSVWLFYYFNFGKNYEHKYKL